MLCHFLKSARTRDKNKSRTKISHEVTSRLESLERVVPVHDGKGLIPWDEGDEIDAQHLGSHFHSCRHHVQCFLQGLILKCVFKKQYLPSRSIVSAAHLQHGRILMTCSDNVIWRGNFESIMPFLYFLKKKTCLPSQCRPRHSRECWPGCSGCNRRAWSTGGPFQGTGSLEIRCCKTQVAKRKGGAYQDKGIRWLIARYR